MGTYDHKDITGAELHAPKAHKTSHEIGGSDKVSAAGIDGYQALQTSDLTLPTFPNWGNIPGLSLSLPAGTYLIIGSSMLQHDSGDSQTRIGISIDGDTPSKGDSGMWYSKTPGQRATITAKALIVIESTKTITLQGMKDGAVAVYKARTDSGILIAIKISEEIT